MADVAVVGDLVDGGIVHEVAALHRSGDALGSVGEVHEPVALLKVRFLYALSQYHKIRLLSTYKQFVWIRKYLIDFKALHCCVHHTTERAEGLHEVLFGHYVINLIRYLVLVKQRVVNLEL